MPDCQKYTCCGDESYTYEVGSATPNPPSVDLYEVELIVVGDGTVSGEGEWLAGSNIQISATAGEGQQFSGWSGDYEGSENPATIFMDGNKSITATFIPQVFYVSLTANPEGSATLTGQGPYNYGDTATIEAIPLGYFEFLNFSGDISSINNPEDVLVNENKSIVANLFRSQFELTLSASPSEGGSPSGGGAYSNGQTAVINSNPASGFCFKSYTGDVSSTLDPENVFMDANKSVTANYAPSACCSPYALMLVLDQTSSIGAAGAAAGINIINTSNISAIGVISFGDPYCNIYPITTDLDAVKAYLQDAIDNPATSPFYCYCDPFSLDPCPGGYENGLDALFQAIQMLQSYSTVNPKAIYLKTDSYTYNTLNGFTANPVTVNTQLNTMSKVFLEFGPDTDTTGTDFGYYAISFPETDIVTYQGFPDCSSY